MNRIIIYGSNYGTTKQYAEELSRKTNIQAIPFKMVDQKINNYDIIIYLGGLYAGGVLGRWNRLFKITLCS